MMKTLDSFASPSRGVQIFRDANPLPPFFQHNLLDPSRVVKHFANDPQANIRVFYYQYLKLCFELENVDFEAYIRRIEELINNEEFKFIFYEEDDPELFSDLQFKQLIMEFFGVLGQGGIAIQDAINYYPIMDTVFIYFFRALLILTGHTDALDSYIDREDLFQFLCSHFGVEISTHDRCIKFADSDIFVYEEDPKDVYMAYMEDIEEEDGGRQQGQDHEYQQQYQQQQYQQQQYQQQQYQQQQYQQQQYQQQQYQQQQYQGQQYQQQSYQQQGYPQQEKYNVQQQYKNSQYQKEPPNNSYLNYSHEETQQQEPTYPPKAGASSFRANVQTVKEQATPIQDISYGSSSSQRGTSEINKSYISSEFVDYTQTNSNLHSMVKKDLKESAEITKQHTFGKILIEPTPPPYPTTTQSYKPPTPEPVYVSPLAVNSYLPPETNKYSSSYLNQFSSDVLPPKPSEYNSKPLSNHQETPFSKKAEQSGFSSKAWEAPPTKDPGFAKSLTQDLYQQGLASKKYGQILQNKFQVQKPASYAYQEKFEVKKPSYYQPTKPASTYTPSNYVSTATIASKAVPVPYKPPSPAPQQYVPYGQPGKGPFNLNVSLEFTNSFTMKVMAEPFRSNVRTIRSRARDYRNSLISFIK